MMHPGVLLTLQLIQPTQIKIKELYYTEMIRTVMSSLPMILS